MRPRCYVFEDDALKVATRDAREIKERIVAVVVQVPEKYSAPKQNWCADS